MHDFFDILGLPSSAPPSEVRRVCARRIRRSHPDFSHGAAPTGPADAAGGPAVRPSLQEVAVDFVEMGVFLDRMQASFFGAR